MQLKRDSYGKIIETLLVFMLADNVESYIRNQCINVISLSFRWMCDSTE